MTCCEEANINFMRGLLGFTRPHIRDGLVLLERVDAWLVDDLVPALCRRGALSLSGRGARTRRREDRSRRDRVRVLG